MSSWPAQTTSRPRRPAVCAGAVGVADHVQQARVLVGLLGHRQRGEAAGFVVPFVTLGRAIGGKRRVEAGPTDDPLTQNGF